MFIRGPAVGESPALLEAQECLTVGIWGNVFVGFRPSVDGSKAGLVGPRTHGRWAEFVTEELTARGH